MKAATALLFLALPNFAATNSLSLLEVDGNHGAQTNRPHTVGRVFADNEILECAQPLVSVNAGAPSAIPSGQWQCDVQTRYASGYVQFAIVSFYKTMNDGDVFVVTFQNATCNNTGFLTKAQMVNFNGGAWGAQMEITAPGVTTQTFNASTMLNALADPATNPECGPTYELKGPVVTRVRVQDCLTGTFDFGFKDQHITTFASSGTLSSTALTIATTYAGDLVTPAVVTMGTEDICIASTTGNTFNVGVTCTGTPSATGRGWNGTTVASHFGQVITTKGVSTVWELAPTGTNPANAYKSLLPSYDLSYYPGPNYASDTCSALDPYCGVESTFILDNDYVERAQDQVYSFVLKAGSPLSIVLDHSSATVTQIAYSRWAATFWSGATPGVVRQDPNLAYLSSTKLIPNYDPLVKPNPASNVSSITPNEVTAFSSSDKGTIGGDCWNAAKAACAGLLWKAYPDNDEAAPLQRADIEYLYNANAATSFDGKDCSNANSDCAQTWYFLFGEKGVIDNSLGATTPGGGLTGAMMQAPYHFRESRSTGSFYCPTQADKGANANSACGSASPNSPVGRVISRYAHTHDQYSGGASSINTVWKVGTFTNAGFSGDMTSHFVDHMFVPYIISGNSVIRDELWFYGATTAVTIADGTAANQSFGFFAYQNPNAAGVARTWGASVNAMAKAALVSPDGSPEKNYFTSLVNSNLEIQEGFIGKTGTSLTPTSDVPTCSVSPPNRWCWGRNTVGKGLTVKLHDMYLGTCPANAIYIQQSKATDGDSYIANRLVGPLINNVAEMGFPAYPVADEIALQLVEMVGEGIRTSPVATFNPFIIGIQQWANRNGTSACGAQLNADPWLPNWDAVDAAAVTAVQNNHTFNDQNSPLHTFVCGDHGYPLLARAELAWAQQRSLTSSDANCDSGLCTANAAWLWAVLHIPYWLNPVAGSNSCTKSDIKFSFTPRVPSGSVIVNGVNIGAVVIH